MLQSSTKHMDQIYDVAICGAGLAGLTLARQIKQKLPDCSVVLVDRMDRNSSEAVFKVGESMTEAGGYYLGERLGLTKYLEDSHIVKLGFRFFFNDGSTAFEDRPEFGLSRFPKVDSYQIDRNRLESDLLALNEQAGIDLVEGLGVQDIVLSENNTPHQIILQARGSTEKQTVQARWVVDAMGRRRFLQKKLGLTREKAGKQNSAAWFRVKGQVDVENFVCPEQQQWHERVPNRIRYFSTNHLMGPGYWVWIIPLATGYTSIGIVADEGAHDFSSFNTFPLAMQFLQDKEPKLAEVLAGREPEDFLVMRRYSYTSRQVFSPKRWTCVGDSGVFAVPFYAAGVEMIGFANTITTEMISSDIEGTLTPERVTAYNQFFLSYNDALTDNIQVAYPFFDNPMAMTGKVLWDTTAAWAFVGSQMFNDAYLDPQKSAQVRAVTAPYFFLTRRMQQLFLQWASLAPSRLTFDFLDFLTIDYLYKMRVRNLAAGKSQSQLIADQEVNMAAIEELAQVIFLIAIEDVLPEHLDRFSGNVWLNAWRLSLDPDRWEADGVFKPKSEPRDLTAMHKEIRNLFKLKERVPA